MQMDRGDKGFSCRKEGPLDMRMDPTQELSAWDIVNKWSEKKLGELFREYGEETRWRKAAEAIVEARKERAIQTTTHLADVLLRALGGGKWHRLHPATLVFQALRIAVNNELGALQEGLSKALDYLQPGGVIGVISFHSLEDRIVKHFFREASLRRKDGVMMAPLLQLLTKKPIEASSDEVRRNPRSRSGKLRGAQRRVEGGL